jgi:hypothetical protein
VDLIDQASSLVEGLSVSLLLVELGSILPDLEGQVSDHVHCLTSCHNLDDFIALKQSHASLIVAGEPAFGGDPHFIRVDSFWLSHEGGLGVVVLLLSEVLLGWVVIEDFSLWVS